MEDAGLLVCQETLGPLEHRADGLWCENAQRLYPIRDNLVYMGYPVRDEAMITATMNEEHAWQGTMDADMLQRDVGFLQQSAPLAVQFINLISRHVTVDDPRALELGCGSGWVSWLLAQAGYDVYMCDFEANSLTLGLNFTHPSLGVGHRIVADARYAPFATGTFDVVLFKEFVHHIADYDPLFREAARVLKPGGMVALMEPTMSVLKRLWQIRHPEPHEGHHIDWPHRYLRSLRRAGLELVLVTSFYDDREPHNPVVRALKRAAARRVAGGHQLDVLSRAHLGLFGGAWLVVLARKVRTVASPQRPAMTLIDPVSADQTSFARYGALVPIVAEAAEGLYRRPRVDKSEAM